MEQNSQGQMDDELLDTEEVHANVAWVPGMAGVGAQIEAQGAVGASEDRDAQREALAKLMKRMATRRDVLLGILDYCRDPHEVSDVDAYVAELQAHNTSVYDGASLGAQLEAAGGLEVVSARAEGADTDTAGNAQPESDGPQVEVIDGVEYLHPVKRSPTLWHTTEAGLELLASFDPAAELRDLLSGDEAYLDIYLRVLDLCADEGGASTAALSSAVDKDPLVQSPRLFAQHFTERLEKAGTVRWDGSWKITETGRAYLEQADQ